MGTSKIITVSTGNVLFIGGFTVYFGSNIIKNIACPYESNISTDKLLSVLKF